MHDIIGIWYDTYDIIAQLYCHRVMYDITVLYYDIITYANIS